MAQLERLKARLEGEDYSDSLLGELLESSKDMIFSLRYPFREEWPDALSPKDYTNQIDIAVAMCNKLGAEGQVGHSENGINRSWSTDDIPKEIINRFVAEAGVL